MNRSIFSEVRYSVFQSGSRLNLFIAINVAVFLVIKLINVIEFLTGSTTDLAEFIIGRLILPAALPNLLKQPWSLISYMFLHEGFLHILFNMLWLFWIGRIFEEFLNTRKFTFVYFAGGLAGALLYILSYNLFPAFANALPHAVALGASASVMAIVVATATLLPDYTFHLLLFGPVRLKWIAIAYIVLDIISISGSNAGGHIAHLGGALLGYLFIIRLRQGNDWSKPFEGIVKKRSKLKVVSGGSKGRKVNEKPSEEEIDRILDKISKSGYDSLSNAEKQTLFKASQK